MVEKEKIVGIIGTAIFAVLLFLLLYFTVFKLDIPPEELGGIPVMFGTMEDAFGLYEPQMTEVVPEPSRSPEVPPYSPNEPMIAQESEPTIDVQAQREEEERRARLAEERRRQELAEQRRREQEAQRREINQQMSGLFGEGSSSRGETEGEGTQGVSTGSATAGATSGIGGIGSYDLGGRSLGRGGLVQPSYTVNDYGTVVVNITVDPAGNVIHAEIGRGTNTPSTSLRSEALRAARGTKFNAINSANNQQGTITYRFNLK